MRKNQLFIFAIFVVFVITSPWAWAQESDSSEFTLEEITVTAEKREVLVQKIPSAVSVIEGGNIIQQGKITTRQILESIPNVTIEGVFGNVSIQAATPDAGINIRGVKFKQTSDGQPPATTATYVDGIFQGIGGNYDVNRVEVLRGPQGTLYGRSATGGVVSFHTNDPKLDEFDMSASTEIGEANLVNLQAALNVPYGDEFALRAAWHHYERDGYYNEEGGWGRTSEGRLKALWKPTEAFDIMLTAALTDRQTNSGGSSARLTDPDTIDYDDTVTDVAEGVVRRTTMYALTANNDFGDSILTYIGSYRYYDDVDSPPEVVVRPGARIMYNQFWNYGEEFTTHELRLASDTDSWLTWLIGMNYYNSEYDRLQSSVAHIQYVDGVESDDPATRDAPIFQQPTIGEVENFGVFTEETFDVTDVFRVTAGLRYDQTTVDAYAAFNMNVNESTDGNRLSLNPPDFVFYGMEKSIEFDNITYKLRLEYDLTPDNMLYALTATGFQPGDLRLTNKMGESGIVFFDLPNDEEKLTSYEVGSKNRFLGNRLQVNFGAFFYEYEGYSVTVNTAVSGPPVYALLPVDLEMYGVELSTDWLVTENDMVSLSVGTTKAEVVGYPDIPELNPTEQWMPEKDLHGIPDMTATLSYDHTFVLPNGGTVVPRAEVRYTSDYYTNSEALTQDHIDEGLKPYAYQDAYIVVDAGTTWASASGLLSVTAYVRNLFDEEYKVSTQTTNGINAVGVTTGDPRAWGLVVSAKY
jgi:iron complex outermembrane receptor protein